MNQKYYTPPPPSFINKESSLFFNKIKIIKTEELIICSCNYDITYFHENLYSQFNILLPNNIKNSVKKRQAEYLAGRYVASKALTELGHHVTNIPTGKHRSPIWPKGVLASITHTNELAACAVKHDSKHQYLGIDFENWLTHSIASQISRSLIHTNEEELLFKNNKNKILLFTLIFSAKESLFKALYPSVGFYFDFSAAKVISVDYRKREFKITLNKNLSEHLRRGQSFNGNYKIYSKGIFTIISK
ncbi:MAG: 4'-phosphopantetheinyl transferase superfamily protein [Pseudoalteromonas sp.]|uniref:4'-phosphopantetheinyl transferase family protein n=1 Tax=Pseudoalteromonas sp. TaxID=53249 RepID=UPI001DC26190|nr:4'-phosphopantetheinyl transferase superfamily protein [Pseudoalteromonas sp.]NRA80054.1 4'-phosphopantetheinyl transferase superfamily protein [Pseudoalteromonas sp.]